MIEHQRRSLSLSDLPALVGEEVAVSGWTSITQAQIDQFALATQDQQWIHVDPQRAAQGPFGATVAHGFLTLSLLPYFFASAIELKDSTWALNYGLNRVRFTAPVPVGSVLRGHFSLLACQALERAGMQLTWQVSVEREGSQQPVCVAESLLRFYP